MDPAASANLLIFNQTTLHPIGLVALVVFVLLAVMLPRRSALLPLILASCFISPAQRVALGGLDFTILRILVLVSIIRIFARGEHKALRLGSIDVAVIVWTLVSSLAYIAREASLGALIYKLGKSIDYMGAYFMFRLFIRSWKDFDRTVRFFVVSSIPLALAFMIEKSTGYNAFSVFGGIPEYTIARMGNLRCQGPYPHPIIAGSFWMSLMPLIIPGWWRGSRNRRWTVFGTISAIIIIITCSSSTPLLGVFFGLIAVAFFPFRRFLRPIRWAAVLSLIALHAVMKAPVWFLIARVDAVGGSTGYHRAFLIDETIRHFSEWALLGTHSTGNWGYYLHDVTNQYILEGVRGGFLALLLFVLILGLSFQKVGRMVRQNSTDRTRLYASWGLGVAMFAHCWMFIGVSYFGQVWIVWYMTLAMIAGLAPARRLRKARPRAAATTPLPPSLARAG
jgi:hypothetical protein